MCYLEIILFRCGDHEVVSSKMCKDEQCGGVVGRSTYKLDCCAPCGMSGWHHVITSLQVSDTKEDLESKPQLPESSAWLDPANTDLNGIAHGHFCQLASKMSVARSRFMGRAMEPEQGASCKQASLRGEAHDLMSQTETESNQMAQLIMPLQPGIEIERTEQAHVGQGHGQKSPSLEYRHRDAIYRRQSVLHHQTSVGFVGRDRLTSSKDDSNTTSDVQRSAASICWRWHDLFAEWRSDLAVQKLAEFLTPEEGLQTERKRGFERTFKPEILSQKQGGHSSTIPQAEVDNGDAPSVDAQSSQSTDTSYANSLLDSLSSTTSLNSKAASFETTNSSTTNDAENYSAADDLVPRIQRNVSELANSIRTKASIDHDSWNRLNVPPGSQLNVKNAPITQECWHMLREYRKAKNVCIRCGTVHQAGAADCEADNATGLQAAEDWILLGSYRWRFNKCDRCGEEPHTYRRCRREPNFVTDLQQARNWHKLQGQPCSKCRQIGKGPDHCRWVDQLLPKCSTGGSHGHAAEDGKHLQPAVEAPITEPAKISGLKCTLEKPRIQQRLVLKRPQLEAKAPAPKTPLSGISYADRVKASSQDHVTPFISDKVPVALRSPYPNSVLHSEATWKKVEDQVRTAPTASEKPITPSISEKVAVTPRSQYPNSVLRLKVTPNKVEDQVRTVPTASEKPITCEKTGAPLPWNDDWRQPTSSPGASSRNAEQVIPEAETSHPNQSWRNPDKPYSGTCDRLQNTTCGNIGNNYDTSTDRIFYGPRQCETEHHTASSSSNPACRRCGLTNHLTINCRPRKYTGTCYTCGEVGHIRHSCPYAKNCGVCGNTEHRSRDCPLPLCTQCGRRNHTAEYCKSTSDRKAYWQTFRCFACGEQGHFENQCPLTV